MQAQQQRHETLQHQLPQGTSEPQAEAAAAFPHQRPQEPYRRGADGVPGLRGRARSGGAGGEGLRKDAAWGCDLEAQSRAWGSLGAGPVLGRFGRGSLEGWGIAHIIQQRRQARPQLGAQEPHGCPWPQQDPPQRAQRSTHEPRVGLAQCAQERGQQRTHVPRLWGQGSWAGVVGGRSQTPPAPARCRARRSRSPSAG